MQALLGYNRKLAWVVLPAIVWACLGLAFALGAAPGGPPPFALHLGWPPGGVVVPGRLLLLEETATGMHLRMGMPEPALARLQDWPAHLPFKLPPNLSVEFTPLPPGPPQEQPPADYRLLDPNTEIRELPRERQAVVTKDYIVVVLPFETRLLPRGADAEQRLRQLLQERPDGWGRLRKWHPGEDKSERRQERRDKFRRGDDKSTPPPAPPEGSTPPPPGG
jgi:hypothetical protein